MTIATVRTFFDGTGHYRQTVPLDGVNYIMYFDFNSRDGNWYLSLHDADDVPISGCVGRKLVVNYLVTQRSQDPEKPAGVLTVTSDTQGDPGLFDLGDGVILGYIPEADVAEIVAEL